MLKNLFILLLLGLVAAMPATALAKATWLGAVDSTWDYGTVPGNWTEDPETGGYYTHTTRISTYANPGDPDPPVWPVIEEGNNTNWGMVSLRNSSLVTQTGGYHKWTNGSDDIAFNLYNDDWWYPGCPTEGSNDASIPATLHMTGGIHDVSGEAVIGYDAEQPVYEGLLNIWGDGIFHITRSGWHPNTLLINTGNDSRIDIRENGQLRVPYELKEVIDAYIDGGSFTWENRHHHVENNQWVHVIETMVVPAGSDSIVAGEVDHWLYRFQDGDEYVVVATDVALIPGDADQDGDVDDADATILASNWLTMSDATWAMGDFNFDGKVDNTDASMLAANYGVVAPPASSVPEPGTLLLLCLGLGSLALIRRR